uniref:Nucleolar 27S pre-rRNA processing Urb2/Npa2 C-terminal domain-containing protein n=1 Tax=Ananas comosus var. bracteatus TaxID=296719 RepID=A0A6V7Q538_ANACO|nr:unnamed protein product [Ananas comosus var. bracteatus]
MELPRPIPSPLPINSERKRTLSSEPHEEEEEDEEANPSPNKKSKLRGVWENVDLILSLQSKDIPLKRKIELVFDFVASESICCDRRVQPVSITRLVSFVGNWMQPVLISSENSRKDLEIWDPCLDHRCWAVLKFCLDKSFISVSPNLLRAITRIARHALLEISGGSSSSGEESSKLFEQVSEYLSVLLSSNSRAFYNAGVDLWISCAVEFVNLFHKVTANDKPGSSGHQVLLALSICLLEHFASFLSGGKGEQVGRLLRIVGEVLSNGLFHPAHINGFLSLQSFKVKHEDTERRGLKVNISSKDAKLHSLLNSEVLNLGCQIINVFRELRQVNYPVLALCKAVRVFRVTGDAGAARYTLFIPSLPLSSQMCLEAVATLACSQSIRAAICNSIKTMPERKAGEFIDELKEDLSETMKWIRHSSFMDGGSLDSLERNTSFSTIWDFNLKTLGRVFSEIYSSVLDSLTITSTNSTLVGNSLESLMTAIRPSFSPLVQNQSDNINKFIPLVQNQSDNIKKFIIFLTGTSVADQEVPDSGSERKNLSWAFVFFFRLYTSCRSLYQQSISLMPPDLARKASELMGSLFSVCHGTEWTDKSNYVDEGYFSWIVKPSISLLDFIKYFRDASFNRSYEDCGPLVYVLHIMALQRLNNLNRKIQAFTFLLDGSRRLFKMQKQRDKDTRKGSKRWKRLLTACSLEAAHLTGFMTHYIQLLFPDRKRTKTVDTQILSSSNEDAWDVSVCSLNENSLSVGIWWLLCQNIDVWCSHASKKDLKYFLTHLLIYGLACEKNKGIKKNGASQLLHKEVSLRHISLELLCDTILYDQTVLSKHMASIFYTIMKNSLSSIVEDAYATCVDLNSLPDWSEILTALEKRNAVYMDSHALHVPPSMSASDLQIKKASVLSFKPEITSCESLLNLLCKIPEVHLTTKSFSQYATCILHLERLVISNLLINHDESISNSPFELLRLFLSCRRTLRYLVVSLNEFNQEAKPLSIFSGIFGSSTIIWLLVSVHTLVGLPHTLFGEFYNQLNNIIFSIIDHTSNIFLNLSSRQMNYDTNEDYASWEYVELIAQALEKQMRKLPVTVEGSISAIKLEACFHILDWKKLSCMLSCLQGFLWGLSSTLENSKNSGRNPQLVDAFKFSNYVAGFENFVDLCIYLLLVDNNQGTVGVHSIHKLDLDFDNGLLSVDSLMDRWTKCPNCEIQNSKLEEISGEVPKIDLSNMHDLKFSLFKELLKGKNPQIAYALRELFVASAAILKLKSIVSVNANSQKCSHMESFSMSILVRTSYMILQEMAEMCGQPNAFSFVWIDGILKYLEVVGVYFSMEDPKFSKEVHTQLMNSHMRAIGKCISLQGKNATLSSHETGSNTKLLQTRNESGHGIMKGLDHEHCIINAFKSRVRMSLRKFIGKPLKLHMNTVIQTVEKALIGVQPGCHAIYNINMGEIDGGKVSLMVAAGIDTLDLVLESQPVNERVLVKNIPSLVGSLFNIILHLQSPTIFYVEKPPSSKSELHPDAGAVVLMCVEVLTKVVGKHSFQMEVCHVSHCLHIPMALFKYFHKIKASRSFPDVNQFIIDRQFMVDLYAACCKLLCTTLKHRTREVERCIAQLENSATTLLSCLETVDATLASIKGYFAWEVQEALKCASFLRRIYEEIRQQKDILAKYSFYFLSNYVSIYSGHGPFQTGIEREIDETLRPGIYSLIDICSAADLQQLHTVLGEGACRSTLAALLHDYKLHFQYEGKI